MSVESPKILVVDDDPDHLRGLLELLKINKLEAVGVSNIEDAMLHSSSPIDLVLLDYHLGDNTGREVIDRWLPKQMATHFIVLSGDRSVSTVVEMMKAGASTYLPKPVTPGRLLDTINKTLQRA